MKQHNRRVWYVLAIVCALCCTERATAQYYTWGSDAASLRWHSIRTPDVRVIYPDTAAALARRTLFYIETVRPYIGYGFNHGPMHIPFVLHPENFQSNGLVMWLPKRIEFLSSPAIDSYSMPWIKQLVAHEYRHAVQYNNINRGVIRVASWILGQQGSTIGLLLMPIWAIEGDAVMSETAMSSFGRGLQPRFTLEYRAMGNLANSRKNLDQWFCGSYREMVPDHYQLGYQICSYAYTHYGENVWNKVARYSARNPYVLLTTTVALKKYYNTSADRLFRETFSDLHHYWQSLPPTEDSAETLVELPDGNYTTYQWPLVINDTTVVAVKTDYDRPSRLVRIDPRTGAEHLLCYTGSISTRPALVGRRILWTEYRRSLLFEQRVNSQLCYLDLDRERPRTWGGVGKRNVLYPEGVRDSLTAWVEYCPDGIYTVVSTSSDGSESRTPAPRGAELHGLAWDDTTDALYVLVTDDSGMYPGRVDAEGIHPLRRGAYITLSNLRARGGKLYFGSIASGRDEVHELDIATGTERRLTTSAYGSFDPAPAREQVFVTTYNKRGYRPALQRIDSTAAVVAPARLPQNVVNPPRATWDVVNLDTVVFSGADIAASDSRHKSRRYRKLPHIINFHSWAPLQLNPYEIIDEQKVDVNVGVTLLTQNLLSNAEGFISYGWNHRQGSLVRGQLHYFGLGVDFSAEGSYGGNQQVYGVNVSDPQVAATWNVPTLGRYHSVSLSATLPLYFQRGYHTRQLSVSTGWNYSNGLVLDLSNLTFNNEGAITNAADAGFHRGLHKLNFSVGFSDVVRRAHRDFASPWGYVVSAGYALNPSNRDFSDLVSGYARIYTPGFFAHNSITAAVAYQTSVGGYRLPSGGSLGYISTRLLPHGFTSADIRSDHYLAASVDYGFPLCYPEGGIPSVLYFKRIRLNIGGDFAQFRTPIKNGYKWKRLWSYGGDVTFDFNIFRQPASGTSSVTISVYKPSGRSVWVTAGLGLPF